MWQLQLLNQYSCKYRILYEGGLFLQIVYDVLLCVCVCVYVCVCVNSYNLETV